MKESRLHTPVTLLRRVGGFMRHRDMGGYAKPAAVLVGGFGRGVWDFRLLQQLLVLKRYPAGLGGILNVPEARGFVLALFST